MASIEDFEGIQGDRFEMLFPWGDNWLSIVVVPVKMDDNNNQYYVVKLKDLILVLRLNEFEEWEELKEGTTQLARHLGQAIENYYCLCA